MIAISIYAPDSYNLIYTYENAWLYLQICYSTGQLTAPCRAVAPVSLIQEDAVLLSMVLPVSIFRQKRCVLPRAGRVAQKRPWHSLIGNPAGSRGSRESPGS